MGKKTNFKKGRERASVFGLGVIKNQPENYGPIN